MGSAVARVDSSQPTAFRLSTGEPVWDLLYPYFARKDIFENPRWLWRISHSLGGDGEVLSCEPIISRGFEYATCNFLGFVPNRLGGEK